MLIVLLIITAVFAVWLIATYNFFVSTQARIKASIQEIGNQLKRQSELIPNLVESAKGYLKHEKGIFKDLTDARKMVAQAVETGDLDKMAEAGAKVASILPSLKIVVEDNPEIKGSEVMTKLMDELRDTSDKIMYARRLVIDLTADYNVKRVSFPSNMVAKMFGIKELSGLKTATEGAHMEVSAKETETPKVNL
jgi:LemA protein